MHIHRHRSNPQILAYIPSKRLQTAAGTTLKAELENAKLE